MVCRRRQCAAQGESHRGSGVGQRVPLPPFASESQDGAYSVCPEQEETPLELRMSTSKQARSCLPLGSRGKVHVTALNVPVQAGRTISARTPAISQTVGVFHACTMRYLGQEFAGPCR